MKRNIYLILLGVLALSFGFTSCDKLDGLDDYKSVEIGGTATQKLCGEYFVTLDAFDGTNWVVDAYSQGYVKVLVYNTANDRADSVWFNDLKFWPTLARISCKATTAEFTACTADNLSKAGETVTVTSGKVIPNGCYTAANNITDSLVIELEWSDDAGSLYRYAGYKRTGFLEDEH